MVGPYYFGKFKNSRILVLGDVFLDEYITGDCSRISPEAPVPILSVDKSFSVLGGAANTAANAASLGGTVTLCCLVGNDAAGATLEQKVADNHIRFHGLKHHLPTIKKTRLLGQKQQLLRIDHEKILPNSREPDVLRFVENILSDTDIIIFSDYAKGFFTKLLCRKIISLCHSKKKRVIIDPRPSNASFYRNCDYITPNWKESLQIAGLPALPISLSLASKTAKQIRNKLNTNILMTLGSEGILLLQKNSDKHFHLATQSREVFDVSGAGDTVIAAFSLAISVGLSPTGAAEIANRAAGVVVGKMGTATVTPEELYAEGESGGKILNRKDLAPLSDFLKSQNKTIVTVNGSFDLLHAGHLHILKEAKALGDVLIVGINSDTSVKKYKGKKRPLIGEEERAEMLLALKFVDFVHIFNETVPMPFLKEIKPHFHVNGSEYGEQCIEAPLIKKYKGKLHIVSKVKGLSTTSLVRKINKKT